jgi:hypothetical protein
MPTTHPKFQIWQNKILKIFVLVKPGTILVFENCLNSIILFHILKPGIQALFLMPSSFTQYNVFIMKFCFKNRFWCQPFTFFLSFFLFFFFLLVQYWSSLLVDLPTSVLVLYLPLIHILKMYTKKLNSAQNTSVSSW